MTQKLTSRADGGADSTGAIPIRVVLVTLDDHVAGPFERVRRELADELPGLDLRMHVATSFSDPRNVAACNADIAQADIVFANMLFLDEHVRAVKPALEARREACDAMVCAMSAGDVVKLTKMGDFRMDGEAKGPLALLKKLRGKSGSGAQKDGGAGQLRMLKMLPRILRFIPGNAQNVRAYFLTLAYWLSGSNENLKNLIRSLVDRYADGPRRALRGTLQVAPPREYPETGLYHPRAQRTITEELADLPRRADARGVVGLIIMRSYVLAGDVAHYDAVIAALEARGLDVVPVFAAGLDARPAIEKYLLRDGRAQIDALVSLTGFSLVGGPAFNDARAAEEILARLDVPYVAALPLEFQSVDSWRGSATGLMPIEATMMVAIPELDGATGSIVFGGRPGPREPMVGITDRVELLARRVDRWIANRRREMAERKVAVVLFNFPPNGGATGTAAHLSVFESLLRVLRSLHAQGYAVEVPADVDALRARILEGNAAQWGTDANVCARVSVEQHVRRETWLAEIERQWGSAPGTHGTDGSSLFVLGANFGNVFVGIQPAFGFEGDPMRLLFDGNFAPTHAFAAFYRWIREDFRADVLLHFGTHGALEFMPGKQVGLSSTCWPERLVGDVPHVYLYAANNPSEGALARRRGAATLVSYLTPPVTRAGIYKGLVDLRATLGRFRATAPGASDAGHLVALVQAQAAALELAPAEPAWSEDDARQETMRLVAALDEIESTLIPCGLHVIGEPMPERARREYLEAIATGAGVALSPDALAGITGGANARKVLELARAERSDRNVAVVNDLIRVDRMLAQDHELPALARALAGRFVRPGPGGDLLRTPDVLPTGRNVHGFDPFAIPSIAAMHEGARHAERLVARHVAEARRAPESVAIVLWGSDNLKSGGAPIGQVLALLGAQPRVDAYGKLCGAELIPLARLGRPRIDVMVTLSGIFRDLLPLQTKLLAEASWLAATADEPSEWNFVRRNALAHAAALGCDLETAALRVFCNSVGAYGSNVSNLVDSGAWDDEDELADTYTKRKCFAYRRDGVVVHHEPLLRRLLAAVDLAYQNVESVELGVTTLDHYFDTLGGIGRAASRERGSAPALPVYITDATQGDGRVRTLSEQVALETRTRSLNPRWAEEMLEHGAEGVRQIEAQVTNTLGWSATTGQVDEWVYRELAHTYVLDERMRARLAALNPKASAKLANRLIEATERSYWKPDRETLAALRRAGDELEDRLEGLVRVA
jgi:magnesium chelatase subunit H